MTTADTREMKAVLAAQRDVEDARAKLDKAHKRRGAAVRRAIDAGETYRGIGRRLGFSHPAVRKIAGR